MSAPRLIDAWSWPASQPPMIAPRMPMTMSQNQPRPLPVTTLLAEEAGDQTDDQVNDLAGCPFEGQACALGEAAIKPNLGD
jgi:hypothetical protein